VSGLLRCFVVGPDARPGHRQPARGGAGAVDDPGPGSSACHHL